MIGKTISHYRILGQIGKGAMGIVYKAEDIHLGRLVAVKMVACHTDSANRNLKARLKREAQAVSKLNHPNVATVYEYGETEDGHPYLVMELIEGQTLAEFIQAGSLTVKRTLDVILAVALALGEAHRHNIIHRDIKPKNVLLNKQGEVKVLDFGLAKQVPKISAGADTDKKEAVTQTVDGVILGTPLYLSPEQALGESVDYRSDIFALGNLLYECLTGKPAFQGQTTIEVCTKIIRDDPPLLETDIKIASDLNRIILKALAKSPHKRYQSIDDFISDLRAVQNRLALEKEQPSLQVSSEVKSATNNNNFWKRTLFSGDTHQLVNTSFQKKISFPQSLVFIFIGTLLIGLISWGGWFMLNDKVHKPPTEVKALFEEGEQALFNGDYVKARDLFLQSTESDKQFALAYIRLAEASAELDYIDEAINAVGQAEQLNSALTSVDKLRLKAVSQAISNDSAQAVAAYQEMTRLSPENEKPRSLLDLARTYEKNEQTDEAIASLQNAVQASPQMAPAYLRLGILYGRKQNIANATEAFEKAKAIYQLMQNSTGATAVTFEQGVIFRSSEYKNEARVKLQQALDAAREISPYYHIRSLLELSRYAINENKEAEAKRHTAEALELAQKYNLKSLVTQSFHILGINALAQRKHNEAEAYFFKALESSQKHGGRRHEAAIRFSLAGLYEQQDKTEDVIKQIEPALNFYRKGKYSKQYSDSLFLYGRAMMQKGDFAAADKVFNEAVEQTTRTDNKPQVAKTHFEIGYLLLNNGLLLQALRHFDQSCSLLINSPDQLTLSYCLMYRSQLQWRLGRYDEAEAALQQMSASVDLLDKKYKKLLGARIKLVQAQIALSRLEPVRARELASQALSDLSTGHGKIEALATLGLSLARAGKEREGLKRCEEAAALAESEIKEDNLRNFALLALAEAKLLMRDGAGTLSAIERFQNEKNAGGIGEFQWKANIIAARAAELLGEKKRSSDYRSRAAEILTQTSQKWDDESFNGYLSRPDVKSLNNLQR